MEIYCSMFIIYTVIITIVYYPRTTHGHGRLIDPPSRASMWRHGFNLPQNDYDDNQGYCGGQQICCNINMTEEADVFIMDDTTEDDTIRVGGFRLDGMIFIFCGLGLLLFVVYLLWNSQCSSKTPDMDERQKEIIKPSHLFAYELEPGVVVMQSKDGEFFRILHEYDPETRGTKHYGASPQTVQMEGTPVHYIPHYTRPVLQTQATAPNADLMDLRQPFSDNYVSQPPPYSPTVYRQ
ncbi:hypothetical protein LOTGIDRAFT_234125 [Lottia gigantea]|uniref:Uncharacterized protein n=1 Tax=Lottia gigantea TaxID=225164 RepID=V3ZZ77_LOTGI|nr:hypothetical protein LOTGIDRAFT_234125 [Lottia gigantea]ESO89722.1 hypothetical protein LOTGIDRAFT_234125 [Lottia gigantea]